MKLLVFTIWSFFIVSCASLSQEECQVINWTETGKLDGLKNRNANTFSTYREAKICIKYDATIQAQYEKGRLQGIKLFCTQKNWFETGKANALNGKTLGGFSFYASRCAKYNVKSLKENMKKAGVKG